jgi:hypothetical protein
VRIQLFASQGRSNGITRATTPLDVVFDNLVVDADSILGKEVLSETSSTIGVQVDAVADAPHLTIDVTSGATEGIPTPLTIDTSLMDTDGSESLSLEINAVPAGATFTNSASDALVVSDGKLTLVPSQTRGLEITVPDDGQFELVVSAHATESRPTSTDMSVSRLHATTTATISLNINRAVPWQNPVTRHDVSGDGFVTSRDVLLIINRLNAVGAGELILGVDLAPPDAHYYDVNGDGFISSNVINFLNRGVAEGDLSGVAAIPRHVDVERLFAQFDDRLSEDENRPPELPVNSDLHIAKLAE